MITPSELSELLEKATPNKIKVEILGSEHADLKLIPRGRFAMLAWGPNTENDARLIEWLWNHKEEIYEILNDLTFPD